MLALLRLNNEMSILRHSNERRICRDAFQGIVDIYCRERVAGHRLYHLPGISYRNRGNEKLEVIFSRADSNVELEVVKYSA